MNHLFEDEWSILSGEIDHMLEYWENYSDVLIEFYREDTERLFRERQELTNPNKNILAIDSVLFAKIPDINRVMGLSIKEKL